MKLKTYEVLTDQELQNNIIKQQLVYRVGNWLEHYIERFSGTHEGTLDDAIEQAQEDLRDAKTFETINEESELIDADPLDDSEGFKYQAELIKVMNLQQIYKTI